MEYISHAFIHKITELYKYEFYIDIERSMMKIIQ